MALLTTTTGPWLKSYLHRSLTTSTPPTLHACYLQVISSVTSRRTLLVYDGLHVANAILTPSAARDLDIDSEELGVTTANLIGHLIAPVSALVLPDHSITPPRVHLILQAARVFPDQLAHRPLGLLPPVHTDPEILDALQANIARSLARLPTHSTFVRHADMPQVVADDMDILDAMRADSRDVASTPPPRLIEQVAPFEPHYSESSAITPGESQPTKRSTQTSAAEGDREDIEVVELAPLSYAVSRPMDRTDPTPDAAVAREDNRDPSPARNGKPAAGITPDATSSELYDFQIAFGVQTPPDLDDEGDAFGEALPQTQHFSSEEDADLGGDEEIEDNFAGGAGNRDGPQDSASAGKGGDRLEKAGNVAGPGGAGAGRARSGEKAKQAKGRARTGEQSKTGEKPPLAPSNGDATVVENNVDAGPVSGGEDGPEHSAEGEEQNKVSKGTNEIKINAKMADARAAQANSRENPPVQIRANPTSLPIPRLRERVAHPRRNGQNAMSGEEAAVEKSDGGDERTGDAKQASQEGSVTRGDKAAEGNGAEIGAEKVRQEDGLEGADGQNPAANGSAKTEAAAGSAPQSDKDKAKGGSSGNGGVEENTAGKGTQIDALPAPDSTPTEMEVDAPRTQNGVKRTAAQLLQNDALATQRKKEDSEGDFYELAMARLEKEIEITRAFKSKVLADPEGYALFPDDFLPPLPSERKRRRKSRSVATSFPPPKFMPGQSVKFEDDALESPSKVAELVPDSAPI